MLTFIYWIIIFVQNVKRVLKKNAEDNIAAIAGHSAFFILLSFIPFLMFALSILAMAGVPRGFLESFISDNLSGDFGVRTGEYFEKMYEATAGVAVTTIIAALWSSGKGVYAVSSAIRVIFGIKDSGNWLTKRIKAVFYTLLLFLVVLVLFGIAVVEGFFDSYIREYLGELPLFLDTLYSLKYILAFIITVILINLMIFLIQLKGMKRKKLVGFFMLLPGSALTALCWVLLTFGFQIYITVFNGFSVYLSLGGIAVLMIWMYFMMYILLFCAQLSHMYSDEIYSFGSRILRRVKKRKNSKKTPKKS